MTNKLIFPETKIDTKAIAASFKRINDAMPTAEQAYKSLNAASKQLRNLNMKSESPKTETRGRRSGSLSEDSLTSQLLNLEVGEYTLKPAVGAEPHSNYSNTINRAKRVEPNRAWQLQTCVGHALSLADVPFKFYKITRTK